MLRLIAIVLLSISATLPSPAQRRDILNPRNPDHVTFSSRNRRGPTRPAQERLPEHRTCETMVMDSILRARYPQLGTLETFEHEMAAALERRGHASLQSDDIVTIPVIVHVVHNGEPVGVGANITAAQVASEIEVLNEDYRKKPGTPGSNTHPAGADTRIQFALARVDPNGRPLAEPGVHRVNAGLDSWSRDQIESQLKPQTQWDPTRYMNIWTVQFDQSTGLLGYAQFPNLSQLDGLDPNMGPASTDGVVINYRAFGREGNVNPPYDGGRTATHEIGHWLGLRHIWGDGDCSVDDFCEDTPNAGKPNYVCDKTLNSCEGGDRDMVENYMDYTNDGCMDIFTLNQAQRMRAVLERSPRRRELLRSTTHLPPAGGDGRPVAAFSADNRQICQGSTVDFRDESTNAPLSWEWSFYFDGAWVASFTDQNPSLTFNGTGQWDVMLVAANDHGADTAFRRNYITSIPDGDLPLPSLVTFEDGQRLEGWVDLNPDGDRTWKVDESVGAGAGGGASATFDNFSMQTDPSGTVDVLVTPRLNLDDGTVPELSFNVAYATYEDADGEYGDTLALFYTTDCGATWIPFWYKGGHSLATAPTTDQMFEPTADEWRRERISLAFLAGRSDVRIAICNLSGWGNALYLDDIGITAEYPTQAPVAAFSADRVDICPGDVVTFSDQSSGYPSAWAWTLDGATPSSSNVQHPRAEYDRPGAFSVVLRAANAAGGSTSMHRPFITVGTPAEVTARADRITIRPGESVTLHAGGASYYLWSNGRDNELVSGSEVTVTPGTTTTYTVIGWSDGVCPGNASVTVTVLDATTGLPSPEIAAATLTLSPNPARDMVALEMRSDEQSDMIISIVDVAGNTVYTLGDAKRDESYRRTLDVSALPAGVYCVRVTTARGTAMARIVVR